MGSVGPVVLLVVFVDGKNVLVVLVDGKNVTTAQEKVLALAQQASGAAIPG